MPRVSVVLPIYRTAQYLAELHRRLVAALEPVCDDFELIMVDDGSPDDAWPRICELGAVDRRIKGIHLSRNFGQHPALTAGLEVATGDLIVYMDADLQDRPEDIPLLLAPLKDDIDIVYSVKPDFEEPALVRATSRIYHAAVSRLTGTSVPRNITSFRAFTKTVAETLKSFPERNILFGPLMFHIGFRYATVPVQHDERRGSPTSYSFHKRLELAINSLLSYTDLPQRFLIWFGLFVLGSSVLYSIALVVQYLVAGRLVAPGLTVIALMISMSLGATMTGLGIIGTYVFRVYQEVLFRPRYIVSRRINFGK